MRRPRPIPLAVAVLAVVAIPVFCALMAVRIARYNKAEPRVVYVFGEIEPATFTYAGREIAITERPAPRPGEYPTLHVAYGDQSFSLPMTLAPRPHAEQVPGLLSYGDWMKVVRFAPITGRTLEELEQAIHAGEERDRLALVTRSVRPGANPETWGRVWRKDWIFDFYEFMPDGSITHDRFAYPTARSAAAAQKRRESEGGIPELDSRSWQFQAADLLMPEGSAPRIIAGDSPLVAASWTFPAAILSVFTATAALLVAFAPARPAAPAGT
ncbi:MAG TPA: hypothetical protein VFF69_10340 [Phycisphaerales bacterium]|nr:hypothetical protein [Phycisphaerales bacterium]